MLRWYLTLILVGTLIHSEAQESIDLFSLTGRIGTPQPYDDGMPGEATESGIFANLKIPFVISPKTIFFNNLTYTFSSVQSGRTFQEGVADPIGLHAFILQTGLVQRIDEKKAFQLLFVPRFMSDELVTTSRAWQFGAVGMYEYRWSKTFMMRFGVMYHQEKAGPLLVPLFDINWDISDKWFISGLFPIYLKLGYKVNERFTAGLSHFGLITSYALNDAAYPHDYLERTSIDLTLFGRWKMADNFYLEGRVGYALDRNYEQYHENEKIDLRVSILRFGDKRDSPINTAFRDGPIGELRVVYNLPIE